MAESVSARCGICSEPYSSLSENRYPKVLVCGHTVCFECLRGIFNFERKCPFCREVITGSLGDISTNFALLELLPASTPPPPSAEKDDLIPIRPGTIVERGPDWEWGDQDGGPGSRGIVMDDVVDEGWVRVMWHASGENNYRWGKEGCYDLRITSLHHEQGLRVKIRTVTRDELKRLQLHHGGFVSDMLNLMGKVGRVDSIQANGGIIVTVEESSYHWAPSMLLPIADHARFSVGEHVSIRKVSVRHMRALQRGHGGTADKMKSHLGRRGEVVGVDSDGDVQVRIEDEAYFWNPELITSRIKSDAIVERGPDWRWGDQDGGPGSRGIVIDDAVDEGWVRVAWRASGENNYRWGKEGCYDLSIVSDEYGLEYEDEQGSDDTDGDEE